MRAFTLTLISVLLAPLALAIPAHDDGTLAPFYLVTTTQSTSSSDSSDLASVSCTSLFDPYYQPAILLRLTGPGYLSIPLFTLSSAGLLQTHAPPPHQSVEVPYDSTKVKKGEELQFLQRKAGTGVQAKPGKVGLKDGYLLTVNGNADGWRLCPGDFGETVLFWKGTEEGCVKTFVQAVSTPPY